MFGHSNSAPSLPRELSINWADWKWRKISVTDESKHNTFYNVECHMRKPNLIFHRPNGVEPVGTVSNSKLGTEVNSNVNGAMLEMRPKNKLTCREWTFYSPSLGRVIIWKGIHGMECHDENGVPIAKFKITNWGMKRLGSFEFLNSNLSQQTIDEVVVTGVGMMYMIVNNTIAALNASNASAAGAAAAAAA
jgi:hypothetical protein